MVDVEVTKEIVRGDPEICVYYVVATGVAGTWHECCPTRDLLNAYLRGLQTYASMNGTHVVFPDEYRPNGIGDT